MLGIFLKAGGQIKNSQACFQEMSEISKQTGTKSSEEWVPFKTIKLRFGLAELSRRIQRGTIVARKAEDDENEYEFRVVKKIAYSDQSTKEEMKGQTTGKMEVDQWLKLKAQTMNSFSSSSGDAMNALCLNAPHAGGQNKRKGTRSNKQASEEAEESGVEEVEEDPDVFKAEQLSDAGSVKIKTAEKLNNMHRLLTKVMKETPGKARKILIAPMQQLDKLKASKKQLKFEEIKGVLFDCAMAVKQAKKMNQARACDMLGASNLPSFSHLRCSRRNFSLFLQLADQTSTWQLQKGRTCNCMCSACVLLAQPCEGPSLLLHNLQALHCSVWLSAGPGMF